MTVYTKTDTVHRKSIDSFYHLW